MLTLSLSGYKSHVADIIAETCPDYRQIPTSVEYGSSLQHCFPEWVDWLYARRDEFVEYTVLSNAPLSLYTAAGFILPTAPAFFGDPDIEVIPESAIVDHPETYVLDTLLPAKETRTIVVYVAFTADRCAWDHSRTSQLHAFFESTDLKIVCLGPHDEGAPELSLGQESLAVFSRDVTRALATISALCPLNVVLITSAPRAYAFCLGMAAKQFVSHDINVYTAELIGASRTQSGAISGGMYECFKL
jgi:hypothetical protein